MTKRAFQAKPIQIYKQYENIRNISIKKQKRKYFELSTKGHIAKNIGQNEWIDLMKSKMP